MDIQALRVGISDKDLNDFVARHLSKDLPIEDLVLAVTAEGVHAKGSYPLFVAVSFDSLWEPGVAADGRLTIRLARLKAFGMPATALRSLVMDLLQSNLKPNVGLEICDDALVIDVDRVLALQGLTTHSHLQEVRCEPGCLTISAGKLDGTSR